MDRHYLYIKTKSNIIIGTVHLESLNISKIKELRTIVQNIEPI